MKKKNNGLSAYGVETSRELTEEQGSDRFVVGVWVVHLF
jgi:hypothetical protein